MSKFQPRIIINNPQKEIPDNIMEQFFLTLKSGDIDKIKEFTLQNKIKFNVVQPSNKTKKSEKTPFHIVLELDDKIANNATKLKIMKFLDQMGAPMDLPDAFNVWPIHLAASLQDPNIVDFLLEKKVDINRKDSSNNTPLHYAINGKDIECPKPVSVKPLTPPQKIENLELNNVLEKSIKTLETFISTDPIISSKIIHIINSIMNLPKMFKGETIDNEIERDTIQIFTEIASDPYFSSGTNKFSNNMIDQQNKLEELINKTFNKIKNTTLSGVTEQIYFSSDKGGWGPKIPTGPGTTRPPENMEKIMEDSESLFKQNIDDKYKELHDHIFQVKKSVDNIAINNLNDESENTLNFLSESIDKLIFGVRNEKKNIINPLCVNTTLSKTFIILSLNYYLHNYPKILTERIMSTFPLMTTDLFNEVRDGNSKRNPDYGFYPNVIFNNSVYDIVNLPKPDTLNKSIIDIVFHIPMHGFYRKIDYIRPQIFLRLRELFSNSENKDIIPINLLETDLCKVEISKLVDNYKTHDPSLEILAKKSPEFMDKTFVQVLDIFINKLRPLLDAMQTNVIYNNLFVSGGVRILRGTILQIPQTPLPYGTFNDPMLDYELNYDNKYTFLEMFRIFHILDTYMTRYNLEGRQCAIMNEKINDWINYVDKIGGTPIHRNIYSNRPPIGIKSRFPSYILIYKLLVLYAQERIKDIIESTIREMLEHITKLDPSVFVFNHMRTVIRAYDSCSLLTVFNAVHPREIVYASILKNTGNPELITPLLEPFISMHNVKLQHVGNIDAINNYFDNIVSDTETRDMIYEIATGLIDNVFEPQKNTILDAVKLFNDFYDGISISENAYSNLLKKVINNDFFKLVDTEIFSNLRFGIKNQYLDVAEDTVKLKQKFITGHDISSNMFMTDIHAGWLYTIRTYIKKQQDIIIDIINLLIIDIKRLINNRRFYYVAQYHLPLLIVNIIMHISYLWEIKNKIAEYSILKSEFYSVVMGDNDNRDQNLKIFDFYQQVLNQIFDKIDSIYTCCTNIIKYHNKCVDFININSANQIINSSRRKIFSNTLSKIKEFPTNIIELTNQNELTKIIDSYNIQNISYHYESPHDNDISHIDEIVKIINRIGTITDRTGKMANSPTIGLNDQINIILGPNTVSDIPVSIAGNWLNYITYNTVDRHINVTSLDQPFKDAFIAYTNSDFTVDVNQGVPLFMQNVIGSYIKKDKHIIIQNIIEQILRLKFDATNKEISDMCNDLLKLANENTYTKISDIKIMILIGQLSDTILNRLLEYSIRQCTTSWIYSVVTDNSTFSSIADRTLKIVEKKNYQKLTLNDFDFDQVTNLINTNSAFIDFGLTQIEPNPSQLTFVTQPVEEDYVQYLFNTTYYSAEATSNNKKCRQINPKIAKKLVNGAVINTKNSDGNTALHNAVMIGNPKLVEILLQYGAKPTSFSNIKGETPYDIAINNLKSHIKFTVSFDNPTLSKIVENFAIPFNDLLVSRLRDEKFGNNIVKDITLGIPIQIIMYNHMFYLFLENYRYGFTLETKNAIKNLFIQDYNHPNIYPVDLFTTENNDQIVNILKSINTNSRTAEIVNKSNKKKIDTINKKISLLESQISSLQKEKITTTDHEQLTFIDELEQKIATEITEHRKKLDKLIIDSNTIVDGHTIQLYQYTVDSMKRSVVDRTFGILDFYNYGFSRIATNDHFHKTIWKNYIDKQLKNTQSMIFPIINDTLYRIINTKKIDEIKNDLDTIFNFFEIVSNYINSKSSLPNNLNDNPILEEECNQVIYLINLILTPAMYNIILNQIYLGLRETDALKTIITDQSAILGEIISATFNNETIHDFLNNSLPKIAYKYFTTIYTNETDADKKILHGPDIFEPIVQIVKSIRIINITDDSVAIRNIRDYLIPFMINTYQNFIYHIRLSIFNYERYLINTHQLIKIVKLLL